MVCPGCRGPMKPVPDSIRWVCVPCVVSGVDFRCSQCQGPVRAWGTSPWRKFWCEPCRAVLVQEDGFLVVEVIATPLRGVDDAKVPLEYDDGAEWSELNRRLCNSVHRGRG